MLVVKRVGQTWSVLGELKRGHTGRGFPKSPGWILGKLWSGVSSGIPQSGKGGGKTSVSHSTGKES